jgi:hypothetical protein
MSLFSSSSSPSSIALHKASYNRSCIPPMIHGAQSLPKSLPSHIPIPLPPSFPSLLDVMGTTASSSAITFQSSEEIVILVSLFSPLVSRVQSQYHNVFCLLALRRPIRMLRLCASRLSFLFILFNLSCVVSQLFRSVGCSGKLSVRESLLPLPAYLHSDSINLAPRLP